MDKFIEVHYKSGNRVSSNPHYINSSCIKEFYSTESEQERTIGVPDMHAKKVDVIKSYYLITERSGYQRIEEISEETYNLLLNTLVGKKILNE